MSLNTRHVLTVAEAARLLAVSPKHIYNLTRSGVLPSVRLGRTVRVPVAAIERLLNAGLPADSTEGGRG